MNIKPYPGYEHHTHQILGFPDGTSTSMAELQASIRGYTLAPGTTMEDREIPGPEDGQQLKIRVITPAGLPEKAPIIFDIHGGGWVSGDMDIDNYRNIYLAEHTPAIVVAVEYRLASPELGHPAQLMDCLCAFRWVHDHAAELGGDPDRLGVHGTSAGGNLAAGMALYIRDHGGPAIALTVLNCPALTLERTDSKLQLGGLGAEGAAYRESAEIIYTMAYLGSTPPYYAMPAYAPSLAGLGPVSVVVGEYDPLRDEDVDFAKRLFRDGVPCELLVAPRVSHGYCTVDQPLTRWTHNGICASFRREFGMDIVDF